MGDARAGRGFDSAPLHAEKRDPPPVWTGAATRALFSMGQLSWHFALLAPGPLACNPICSAPSASQHQVFLSLRVPVPVPVVSLRPLPEHWLGRGWPPLLSRPSAHLASRALDTVDVGVSGLSGTLHPSMPNMCCLSCQRPSSDPAFQRGAEGPLGGPRKTTSASAFLGPGLVLHSWKPLG